MERSRQRSGCENTRIIIEKSGIPVAGVVSRQDLEWLEERDWNLAELRATMDDIRRPFRDDPSEEFNRAVEAAVRETRAPFDDHPLA